MGALPLHGRQVGRDDVAQQGVHEPVATLALLDDEVPGDEVLQRLADPVGGDLATDAGDHVGAGELMACDGEDADDGGRGR